MIDNVILSNVKNLAGMEADEEGFNTDLTVYINTVFSTLNQLGVGPPEGFAITDGSEVWSDFTDDKVLIGFVKTYMSTKVKMNFDPPASAALLKAMEETCNELQWRIQVHVESKGLIPDPKVIEN